MEICIDVNFVGERSSPWPFGSVTVEMKFHSDCKLHFTCAQFRLRQMHSTNVSVSIEVKY